MNFSLNKYESNSGNCLLSTESGTRNASPKPWPCKYNHDYLVCNGAFQSLQFKCKSRHISSMPEALGTTRAKTNVNGRMRWNDDLETEPDANDGTGLCGRMHLSGNSSGYQLDMVGYRVLVKNVILHITHSYVRMTL